MNVKNFVKISFLLSTIFFKTSIAQSNYMHIVTASDSEYFRYLFNFIGSIHRVNFNELAEISIFDLGFTSEQLRILNSMEKVHVYPIEITNPSILTPMKRHPHENKYARGLYSWKPVVMKQALDMFDCILYADASAIFISPLNNLFEHIKTNGYFLITCHHSIEWMTNRLITKELNLHDNNNKWILAKDTHGLSAGFQGLTKTVYDSYIIPVYELSKDIQYFIDDGSTPYGYTGRHDQTLFSIYARLNKYYIFPSWDGTFLTNGQKTSFHIAPGSDHAAIARADIIIHGDHQSQYNFKSSICYKK